MPVLMEEEEDWTRIADLKLRRRVQNRIHQRKHSENALIFGGISYIIFLRSQKF